MTLVICMHQIYDFSKKEDLILCFSNNFKDFKNIFDRKQYINADHLMKNIFRGNFINDINKFEYILQNDFSFENMGQHFNLINNPYFYITNIKHLDLLIKYKFPFNDCNPSIRPYSFIKNDEVFQYFHKNVDYPNKKYDILDSSINLAKIKNFNKIKYLLDDPFCIDLIHSESIYGRPKKNQKNIAIQPLLFSAFEEANMPLIYLLHEKGANFHVQFKNRDAYNNIIYKKEITENSEYSETNKFLQLSDSEKEKYLQSITDLQSKKLFSSINVRETKLKNFNTILNKGNSIEDFISLCILMEKEKISNSMSGVQQTTTKKKRL